jgi:hypothetical protein
VAQEAYAQTEAKAPQDEGEIQVSLRSARSTSPHVVHVVVVNVEENATNSCSRKNAAGHSGFLVVAGVQLISLSNLSVSHCY